MLHRQLLRRSKGIPGKACHGEGQEQEERSSGDHVGKDNKYSYARMINNRINYVIMLYFASLLEYESFVGWIIRVTDRVVAG